nr:immunoglobulin heavy chain junction region [Mus musculus]
CARNEQYAYYSNYYALDYW